MSKLDELIKKHCPDGVKYIPIKKCVNSVEKIRWSDSDMESYQYIDLSSVNRDTHLISDITTIDKDNAPSRAQQIVQEGDIIFGTTRPMLKRYCMIDINYDGQICSTGFCVLRADDNIVLNSWLYHNITSSSFFDHVEKLQKGASYPAISDANVKSFKIPVPPLPVQEEIVRILDSFTSLTAELQDKLNTEFQARKKQYEYYCKKLFLRNENSRWVKLVDIADIGTGNTNTNEAEEDGIYPFYVRSQEPLRKNTYEYDETAIITAGDGVGVGKVYHFVEGKYALHQRAYRIHINTENVIPKYFFYYMRNTFYDYIQKTMFQGSVASIRRPMLNQFPVPIPDIKEQEKIVTILDRFDTICNDITTGLPAEIATRQKQYEYYRDKLLTFKELS